MPCGIYGISGRTAVSVTMGHGADAVALLKSQRGTSVEWKRRLNRPSWDLPEVGHMLSGGAAIDCSQLNIGPLALGYRRSTCEATYAARPGFADPP